MDRLEETYEDKFNIVRINVEKSDGVELAREYGLVGQPFYLFFDSTNEEVRRMAGPHSFDVMATEIGRLLQE